MSTKSRTINWGGNTLVVQDLQLSSRADGGNPTSLSGTEIAALDGVTAGTVTASKALIVDSNKDLATLRHLTISGNLVSGATAISEADLGFIDGLTAGTAAASKAVVLDASKGITTITSATITTLTSTNIAGTPNFTGAVTAASTLGVTGALTPIGGVVAAGSFAAAPRLVHSGGLPARVSTDGTDSTPSATETYIAEVYVPCNMSVTGVATMNGTVAGTDNLVVALYNSSGVVVANSALAGTAASGVDSYQRVAFTAPYAAVGPATYYVSTSYNGTTTRFNTHVLGNFGASKAIAQTFGTLATITPPTTFTTGVGPIASLY